MKVVIVESPAKAKSINKYLGSGYKVIASYGHVRDLPSKNGSVDPDQGFTMIWEVSSDSKKHIKAIEDEVKQADALYLATDPDREGEAIAWHVLEILKEKKLLENKKIYRSVFYEITKKAVVAAIENPRELNNELIEAYLARRALDYLVGFNISPVLWRKLPGSKSAGRVQSVALRLITEREGEIEKFVPQEYWTIDVNFLTTSSKKVIARLTHLDGEKLDKFSLKDEKSAKAAVSKIEQQSFSIESIKKKQVKRNPAPPFITSTLQQEASRKLGFGAGRTMQTAQKLYEGFELGGETVGLITYMRTDSVNMSNDAIQACRKLIAAEYGKDYVPESPRVYKSKAKNAQEAHEAIRPTDLSRTPKSLSGVLDPQQLKLYDLIWKRAMASQMNSAILDQVSVDIISEDAKIKLRATGSTIAFDGFYVLYKEGRDDDQDEDQEKILPPLKEHEKMDKDTINPEQHFTQPPPRYSEASLVKKLEELGIGRPSTYASIIQVLQARNYVRLEKKQFIPEGRGRLVSTFLQNYFPKYVEYDFTADLENELDKISTGDLDWKNVLKTFWSNFIQTIDKTTDLKVSDVLDVLDEELGQYFFPEEKRTCPECKEDKLHLKLGKFGAFIGCENYPDCKYTQQISDKSKKDGEEEQQMETKKDEAFPKLLGKDPETEEEITLRKGPYGPYIQCGEGKGKQKPKRAPVLKGMTLEDIDLEKALNLLSLPRNLGKHPETGEDVLAGVGRYGPYIKHGNTFISLKGQDVLSINLGEAVEVINTAPKKKK
jgi:DNA topoisomerase-1